MKSNDPYSRRTAPLTSKHCISYIYVLNILNMVYTLRDCNNYRGVSLLPTTYKILSNILLSRLIPYAKEIIGDFQCGFRRNRSTIDHTFCIRQILEKKNGNTVRKFISTSRKLMIQLGGRSYIRFSLSLVSLGNL